MYSYIGNEADIVFIIGMEEPKTNEEKRILYTALIRPKKELFLTSSFPYFNLDHYFDIRYLNIANNQRSLSIPYIGLPIIIQQGALTKSQFENCSIDSLTLKVSRDAVPSFKYVFKQNKSSGNNRLIKQKNCMSEHIEVNFVVRYFNCQLSVEQVLIHGIDICQVVDKDSELMRDFISGMYDTCKSSFIAGNELVIYRPFDKKNANQYADEKAIKFEFRLKGETIKTRYAFGKNVNALSLIQSIEEDAEFIGKTFRRILKSRESEVKTPV